MRLLPALLASLIISILSLEYASAGGIITQATIIREELDRGDIPSLGPKVLQANDRVSTLGYELTALDEISNPSNWSGVLLVDIDPTSRVIRLIPDSAMEFQTASVRLSTLYFGVSTFISDFFLAKETALSGSDPYVITALTDGFTFFDMSIAVSDPASGALLRFSPAGFLEFQYVSPVSVAAPPLSLLLMSLIAISCQTHRRKTGKFLLLRR
jgi:hypothetical protein